ncbi:MAG: Eco57I restriction-modification methylase domain-containing protein, partial [Verrucomicrobia bacterium]|nr:Eco57I restriction-modification methylase domain-containing protein [Verrucomicrobiota bacterium]
QAVEVAKLSLWIRYMALNRDAFRDRLRSRARRGKPLNLLPNLSHNLKCGNSLIGDKTVAGDAAFDWQLEFPEAMQRGGFDAVIGNPPYERIQTMQTHGPEGVAFLKANYRSAASGNFDIYVCFIERGLAILKAKGHLGYICPHKFFQAEYGEPLRKLLSAGQHVRHILSFGDLQIFPQVSTYTCLIFLGKEPAKAIGFSQVAKLDSFAERREVGQSFSVKASSLSSSQWIFVSEETLGWMKKADAAGRPLGEAAKQVFVGLQTSADDVFLFEAVPAAKGTCTVRSESLGKQVKLETTLLKPVVRSGEIGRFWAKPTHFVLFPYTLRNSEAELISETELAKKFPLTWDYLLQNRTQLAARENGKFAGKGWWQLYPKNLEFWESPKILAPYMIQRLAAHYDTDDNYFVNVTTGGFGLRFGSEQQNKFVCGLMNSHLLDAYLKQVSTNFRGGYFAANKQFLDKLPIKVIDPNNKSEAKLERDIVVRVESIQVAHRQRLKLPIVLCRLIAHSAERVPCSLSHYLQPDFAATVKWDILIDDVQRAGFVHEILIESDGKEVTLTATVADKPDDEPRPLPVLRLTFKDDALRQFFYVCWRQFLAEHSRQPNIPARRNGRRARSRKQFILCSSTPSNRWSISPPPPATTSASFAN